MRRWTRLFPLLITALWLPLQAVASVAMPACRHGSEQPVEAAAPAPDEHCAMHESGPKDQSGEDRGGSHQGCQSCDGCGLCHLAGAAYMPTAMGIAGLIAAPRVFVALPLLVSTSHIPEPPQHPPRSLS
jgi:ABC-type nickel/cobalt efflux system permease component RcnA